MLNDVARELEQANRGLIGLVGRQGVGKSSALMALMKGVPFSVRPENAKILFKWRREKELFATLLNKTCWYLSEAHRAFFRARMLNVVLVQPFLIKGTF